MPICCIMSVAAFKVQVASSHSFDGHAMAFKTKNIYYLALIKKKFTNSLLIRKDCLKQVDD